MQRSRIPSPARSHGAITPRRKTRSTRSVGSPARSSTSGRLTSIIDQFKEANRDSFAPSPLSKTVLNDNTDIEQPRRQSWWKKVNHSRNISEVLESGKAMEPNNIMDDLDMEVLSQEKKNYSLDLPESSGSESIASIVIPQRKLLAQKENVPQNKFGKMFGSSKSMASQNQTNAEDKTMNVSTKTLFGQGAKRSKPAFPAGLLNLSPDKTLANKTKELATEVKVQPRNLFGNRPAAKKRNMFTDFIVSESEDEISEIQPKLFAFQRNSNPVRHSTASRGNRDTSPTSSHTTDIDMDDWKMLPSSTMVEHQFDALASSTPGRKTRLSKLSEAKESSAGTNSNKSINKTKLSNKSASKNKSKLTPDVTTKETELEKGNTSNSNESKPIENKCEVETTMKEQNSPINKSKSRANKTKNTSQKTITENEDMIDANGAANIINNQTQVLNKTGNKNLPVIDEKSREVTGIQSEANSRVLNNQTYKVNNETAKANIMQNKSDDEDENITLTYDDNEQPEDRDKTVEEKVEEMFKEHNKPAVNISVQTQDKSKIQTVAAKIQSEIPKDSERQENNDQNINALDINAVQNDEEKPEADHQIAEGQDKVTGDNSIDNQEDKVPINAEIYKEQTQVDGGAMDIDQEIEAGQALSEAANSGNGAKQQEVNAETDQNEEAYDYDEKVQNVRKAKKSQEIQNESKTEKNEDQSENIEIENEMNEIDSEVENMEEQNEGDQEEKDNEIEESDEEGVQNEEKQNESEVDEEDENEREIEEGDEEKVQSEEQQHESDVEVDQEDQNESEIEDGDEEEVQNEEEQHESDVEVDQKDQNESEIEDGDDVEVQNDVEVEQEEHSESEIEEGDEEGAQSYEENEDEVEQNEDEEENEDVEPEQDNETEDVIEESEENPDVEMEVLESEQEDTKEIDAPQETSEAEAETPNVTHDTTGRHRQKDIKSPEAILHNMSNPNDSFIAKGRNTSIRKTLLKNFTVRQSEVPLRESTGLDDGSKNSTAEGSGWDSHRTTRKTLRQTFGKDFTPRKSLRALVMEKSAKRQTAINEANAKLHQANSTELPDHNAPDIDVEFDNVDVVNESDHEASRRARQTTLEMHLQKVKKENMERKLKIEAKVKERMKSLLNSVKTGYLNCAPYKGIRKPKMKLTQNAPKAKRTRTNVVSLDDLPEEVLNDLKYKPPKRYRPANASWITKRLYTFLEAKLEPKYDYKARVRAEKLVEMLYEFAREARKQQRVASPQAVAQMKHEMARLDIVKTHFEFYDFIREYLPMEVKVKVVPDIVNNIPLPRTGVFSDILQ